MREATLGDLSSLDAVRPRKAGAARPTSARSGKAPKRRGAFRRFRARLTVTVATAAFAAIMVGIVVNATVMQKGHHPAPLFGSSAPDVAASAPRPVQKVAVAPPSPVPVEADPAPAIDERAGGSAPAAVPAPAIHHAATHAAAPVHHAATPKAVDGIAALLGRSRPRASASGTSKVARVRPGQPATPTKAATARAGSPLPLHPRVTAQVAEKTN